MPTIRGRCGEPSKGGVDHALTLEVAVIDLEVCRERQRLLEVQRADVVEEAHREHIRHARIVVEARVEPEAREGVRGTIALVAGGTHRERAEGNDLRIARRSGDRGQRRRRRLGVGDVKNERGGWKAADKRGADSQGAAGLRSESVKTVSAVDPNPPPNRTS